MIRLFYFILFLVFNKLSAQQDLQWYVIDGQGKEEGTPPSYSNPINNGDFFIDSVKHPGSYVNGGLPKNDVFIIYDGNNNFNSHGTSNVFINQNVLYYGYNINSIYPPNYLYFSNLYETDDPPKRVRVKGGHYVRNPMNNPNLDAASTIGVTNTTACLSLNQDFVVGKDVTLILNYNSIKNLIQGCRNISTIDLIYDNTIFSPSQIFSPTTPQFAYSMNGITHTPGKITINLNSSTSTYNYLNFRILNTNKSTGTFTLNSEQCKEVSYPSISAGISSTFHDPNYISVQCVYKDASGTPWVKYRIQAYNDGATSSRALIKFRTSLPNTVDPNTVRICKWNHAGKAGCGDNQNISYDYANGISGFDFSNVPMARGTGGHHNPNKCQMAWVEFCVKVISTESLATVDLQPIYRITNFSNTGLSENYDITNYYDACKAKKVENIEICERPVSLNCNCSCNQQR